MDLCGVGGDGSWGKLGNNQYSVSSRAPTQVWGVGATGYLTDITDVTSGDDHTCAMKSNGTAFCWGSGNYGRLGRGNDNDAYTPVQVKDYNNRGFIDSVKKISAGIMNNCVIKNDDSGWCWGYGGSNGTGVFIDNFSPVFIHDPNGGWEFYTNVYSANGDYVSEAIDMGGNKNLTTMSLAVTTPTGTTAKVQLRTANTTIGLSTATWYGPTGTDDYYTSATNTINIALTGKRYLQYKVFLDTNISHTTPNFRGITINHESYANSGSLISSPFDAENASNILSGINWIKSTPAGTNIKFQIRTAENSEAVVGKDWLGPDGTSNSYFTDNLGGETMPTAATDQFNDRWIQYKAILESSDTLFTPTIYDVGLVYVVNGPPNFESSYETNGIGIRAQTDNPGVFNFYYSVGDTDTSQGSPANKYKLWPSFQYTLDNGQNWTTIAPSELTGPSTENPIVLTGDGVYTREMTSWNAITALSNRYETVKVRMVIDDHEAANNSTTLTSEAFILDTKSPVGASIDGGGIGININKNVITSLAADKTRDRNVTLYFDADDDSNLKLKYSTNSNFTGAEYQDFVSSIGYTLTGDDGSKRIYAKFKDYYGNESESYSDLIKFDTTPPSNPSSLFSQDISSVAANDSRVFINWAINADSDWTSYKVYRTENGTDFNFVQTISNINTNYIVQSGLTNLQNYTYKITCLDDLNNESTGSTISQTLGLNPRDEIAPKITNIRTINKTTSSITIAWTTDEIANSEVVYSTDLNYGESRISAGYTKNHLVTLIGLEPGTSYNFKVRTSDATGNSNDSDNNSFTTNQADTTGPVLSLISTSEINQSMATVSFVSNELATSFLEYSTTSGFSSGSILGYGSFNLNHSIMLKSLTPATIYYYRIRSKDISENETISGEQSFITDSSITDTNGPIISGISVTNLEYNTATIQFTTDEKSSSYIEFGRDTSYGRIYGQDLMVTSHEVTLPYDLKPGTIYYYRVRTRDASGNEKIGDMKTFTTDDSPNDITAPTISGVEISEPGQNSMVINWITNELSSSYVDYGQDLTYPKEQGNTTMTKNHSITLVNLDPKTQYYLRIKSIDPSGNVAINNNESQGYLAVTIDGDNPPTIYANQIRNVGQSSADIYWETNLFSNSFVEYGVDESYGNWVGLNNSTDAHNIKLNGLLSGITYNFRVRSGISGGAERVSQNYTLTTQGIAITEAVVEESDDLSDNTILDTIKNGTSSLIKKILSIIPNTAISESDFIDSMSSMSPKIVAAPSISSGNITVDPGVDKITIIWATDKKSNSIVAYAKDKDYDQNKSEPYTTTAGKADDSVTSHSVEITGLDPNTTYHYQVRSKAEYGNWSKSQDLTFTTLSINSEIKDLSFSDIGEKTVKVSWSTSFESRAMVEVVDVLMGKSVLKSEEKGFEKLHSFSTDTLQTSTNYKLKIVTIAKDGTMSEGSFYPFATTTSSNPPEISNVRISNALMSNSTNQVQTIISWKTDKSSTSRIFYDEGLVKELTQSTTLDKALIIDHVVVTTTLKPGRAYKFRVESGDANGKISTSKDYIIMTPKPQESVINLIINNFAQSFSFITKTKK